MSTEAEPEPTSPGEFYGELSPKGQWFWAGTGRPEDEWIPNLNPDFDTSQKTKEQPTQQLTSSQVAYDWYELYLTPVTGP